MDAAERKAYRRHLTAWCRAHGVVATGQAWEAVSTGERDLPTLYRLNMADNLNPEKDQDGNHLPAAIREGDYLDDLGGTATGPAVRDPETGTYWLTIRVQRTGSAADEYETRDTAERDVELLPGTPVKFTRKRTPPPWLQAALDEYQHARWAWEQARDEASMGYAAERAEFIRDNPWPRLSDFIKEHAERMREPEPYDLADLDAAAA